jgi:exodeoxyribonuclease V alpha subunit
LGPKRTAMIGRAWEEQKAIKEVMVFLQGVGVSTSLAVRIYKKYGDGSISVVRSEPYRLAAEVWGIGFKTADAIAQAVGIPHDSPQRVQAGIQYTLSEAADNGHCYLPEPNLLTDAAQILGVDADLVRACLAELAAAEGVIREPVPGIGGGTVPAVYLVPFTGPRPRWPRPCCACPPPRRTGCPPSAPLTGTRRWRGCGPAPGRSWPPSRSRRCAWR